MSTPRPAKRRRTASPELHAPSPAGAPPPAATDAGQTLDASGSGEGPEGEGAQLDQQEDAYRELTAEELAEKERIYELIAEEYHDVVAELPLEYHRTFALLKELEDQQQNHTASLRTSLEAYISSLSSPTPVPSSSATTSTANGQKAPPSTKEKMAELSRLATAAIRAGEDKVGIAVSLYESVDRHIRRLDADLAKYEDTLVLGLREDTLPSHDAPAAGRKSPPGATTSRGAIALGEHEAYDAPGGSSSAVEGGSEGQAGRKTRRPQKDPQEKEKEREWKRRREVQKLERKEEKKKEKEMAEVQVGMPIDPNEPVYCYCRRVSFGEMIACENEDCPREWYHLDCVGLDKAPEGEWYCDDCDPGKKR
ncbi:hypothetical protein JCM10213_000675 [Rhodosporidiobolus nylandii]